MTRRIATSIVSIAAVSALMAGAAATAVAQDSATPSPQVTEDSVPRPAHIHSGTCDDLGDVVYPLTSVGDVALAASPVPSPVVEQPASPEVMQGEVVIESITEIDAPLDDLLAEEHAINVHESAEAINVYIACGDITGEPEDGRLTIELNELNDSGFAGSAVLEETGDDTTTVIVTLQDTGVPATPGA